MKKLIHITIALLSLWSCAQFDDSKIWDEFKNYYDRLEKVEAACNLMNSNISALQAIVTALQGNDYVTGVAEIVEDGEVVGYTITFSKSGVVKIYHGKDGAAGADGAPGADGRPGADGAAGSDGVDGKDGHSPVVGVRKDVDGVYYWTIDGEWMLDDEGQKVPATGKDGADASAGSDGKDGVTPLLKIEDGYWFVSYDGGSNWTKLYKAVGENGADGATGAPGQDGADGKDGQSFFQGVDTTSSEDYIVLTLSDGTLIKLPTWKAFEELQTMVNKLNTNLSALQTIVEALQNNDYVTDIQPIIDNGIEIGYTILFAKSPSITIFHGKDGADGSDGAAGAPGQDGEAGKDGYTPVLGVKAADDDWSLDNDWDGDSEGQTRYYWTLDGEWLLDSDGNRIPASGTNGTDGSNGSNGQNGATPKLKIVDGYWYISLDGGQTWQPEPLGPATAGAGGSIFTDISYDSAYLYITLSDGEKICLSRHSESFSDYVKLDTIDIDGISVTFTGQICVNPSDLVYAKVSLYYCKVNDDDKFNIHDAQVISTTKFSDDNKFSITLSDLICDADYLYCIALQIRSDETYSAVEKFTTFDKYLQDYTILSEYQYPNTWCKTGIYSSIGGEPTRLVAHFKYDRPESDPNRPEDFPQCKRQYLMGSYGGFFIGVDTATKTITNGQGVGSYALEVGHTYYLSIVINKDDTLTTTLYDGEDSGLSNPLDSISRNAGNIEYEIWLGIFHFQSENPRNYIYNGLRVNKFEIYSFDNTLMLSAMPAKRNSDNVYGVYDYVSRRFIPETDKL